MLFHMFVIASEEKRLSGIFGEKYAAYCEQVPRLLPRFHGYQSSDKLSLNPQLVGKAIGDAVWFLFSLLIVEYIEHLRADSVLPTVLTWKY